MRQAKMTIKVDRISKYANGSVLILAQIGQKGA
jgi:hypothetical protein